MPEGARPDTLDHRPVTNGADVLLMIGDEAGSSMVLIYTLGRAYPDVEQGLSSLHYGFTTKSGEVIFHSGHRFHALVNLDASSSYENHGVGIAVVSGEKIMILNQGENDYEAWIREAATWDPPPDPYPYRYRYYDQSDAERDHHVGDDGWSLH